MNTTDKSTTDRPFIEVGPISGFPEWLPGLQLIEQRLTDQIRRQYELYGFAPIETPAVERMSVLTAKSGMQRQIFTIGRPADDEAEDAELGLHFDLTVPLARYVAQRSDDLTFPFRRYQIQKVWRGERAQRGRFREFTQCDIDIVGAGSLELVHDAEVLAAVNGVFDAMGVLPDFEIRVSNRKILGGLFRAGEVEPEQAIRGLRAIDKSSRHGIETLWPTLTDANIPAHVIESVLQLMEAKTLDQARQVLDAAGAATNGVDELAEVTENAVHLGLPAERLRVDYTIARGLDYYTGTICETFVSGHEAWGSVCSGGRYDDLSSYFSRRAFPGVGVSIGLSRLLDLLVQGEYLTIEASTPTRVLVTMQDRTRYFRDYLGLVRTLRTAGIPTESYLESASLRDQIAYASARGISLAVIAGASEFSNDTVTVRDLRHHVQDVITGDDLVAHVRRLLDQGRG